MDEIKQAYDKLYGDMGLADNDVAFYVFKSGWEAALQHRQQEERNEV